MRAHYKLALRALKNSARFTQKMRVGCRPIRTTNIHSYSQGTAAGRRKRRANARTSTYDQNASSLSLERRLFVIFKRGKVAVRVP